MKRSASYNINFTFNSLFIFKAADAKYKEIRLSDPEKIPTYYEKRHIRTDHRSDWVRLTQRKSDRKVYKDYQHYKLIQREILVEYDGTESFGKEIVVIF